MKLYLAILAGLLLVASASAQAPTDTRESAITGYGYFNEPTCPNGVTPKLDGVFTLNNGRTWSPIYSCAT